MTKTYLASDGSEQILPDQPKKSFGRWFVLLGWRHIIGILACLFAAFPIVYVFSSSLNPSGTMTGSNKLFSVVSLENYVTLFTQSNRPYGKWYLNTTLLATVTAILTVLFAALAAYAFSRLRFYGRRSGLFSLMLIQMFPQMLNVIAIFLLLTNLGEVIPTVGIGSLVALMFVYLGGALGANTYLMYGFFNSVPKALDEAARVDGAGHARIFFTIILPLVVPSLAVVGLLSFLNTFNEYVLASVIVGNDPNKLTLAVGLSQYISEETNSNWPVFAAGTVLACLPPLAVFSWLQKYLVGGLSSGAVK